MDDRPYVEPGSDHPACGICPSRLFPRGQFVIYDRPTREAPFNSADGHRYTADGTPACVHPDKVGLEPDRIAPPPRLQPALSPEPAATPRCKRWSWLFLGR